MGYYALMIKGNDSVVPSHWQCPVWSKTRKHAVGCNKLEMCLPQNISIFSFNAELTTNTSLDDSEVADHWVG